MPSNLRVAAVHFSPQGNSIQSNIARARAAIAQAAAAGVNMIVLPELTFAPATDSVEAAAMASQSAIGEQTLQIASLAVELGVYVVFGFVESAGGSFQNSAALVSPDGALDVFRKRNLWGDDFFWCTPRQGYDSPASVPTPFGNVGVLIGHDYDNVSRVDDYFEESAPFYRRGSLDVLCLLCAGASNDAMAMWVKAASEMRCVVVAANSTRDDSTLVAPSCVIDGRKPPVRVVDRSSSSSEISFAAASMPSRTLTYLEHT